MNLRWDGTFRRFIAEFSPDFQGDLAAVKAAGFKPDTSSGALVWWTGKAAPLTKLRENRPTSGLTITSEAREQYTALASTEAKNAEIKAAAKKAEKEQKKTRPQKSWVPEKGYLDASDLPPIPASEKTYTPPPPPEIACIICSAPIYFYEKQDPPTCLWCEIKVLDNATEVC